MPAYLVLAYRREKANGKLRLDKPTRNVCDGLIEHILCSSQASCHIIAVAGYKEAGDDKTLAQLITDRLKPGLSNLCRIEIPELTWSTLSELRAGFAYAEHVAGQELIIVSRPDHIRPQVKILAEYLQWRYHPHVDFKLQGFGSYHEPRMLRWWNTAKSLVQLAAEEVGIAPVLYRLFSHWHRPPGSIHPPNSIAHPT